MTEIIIDIRRPNEAGDNVNVFGEIEWYPSHRHIAGEEIILPTGFIQPLDGAVVSVQVEPNDNTYCWAVIERTLDAHGEHDLYRRFVTVPASATPINYADLTDVDPADYAPIPAPIYPDAVAVRYTSNFTATGLTYTGTGTNAPGYYSYFLRIGQLVHFTIQINCSTVTNFGTGQLQASLPFMPLVGYNHFAGWIWRDPDIPADDANHIILNVDHVGQTKTLDMHFLVGAPANPKPVIENKLIQGAPGYDLTTVSKIYITGTYITSE